MGVERTASKRRTKAAESSTVKGVAGRSMMGEEWFHSASRGVWGCKRERQRLQDAAGRSRYAPVARDDERGRRWESNSRTAPSDWDAGRDSDESDL